MKTRSGNNFFLTVCDVSFYCWKNDLGEQDRLNSSLSNVSPTATDIIEMIVNWWIKKKSKLHLLFLMSIFPCFLWELYFLFFSPSPVLANLTVLQDLFPWRLGKKSIVYRSRLFLFKVWNAIPGKAYFSNFSFFNSPFTFTVLNWISIESFLSLFYFILAIYFEPESFKHGQQRLAFVQSFYRLYGYMKKCNEETECGSKPQMTSLKIYIIYNL